MLHCIIIYAALSKQQNTTLYCIKLYFTTVYHTTPHHTIHAREIFGPISPSRYRNCKVARNISSIVILILLTPLAVEACNHAWRAKSKYVHVLYGKTWTFLLALETISSVRFHIELPSMRYFSQLPYHAFFLFSSLLSVLLLSSLEP
jgi:uncharacterized membrane protein